MTALPLTHHEILALAAPFARTGRHVDLAASDRIARRLAFRVRTHDARPPLPAVHETLVLEPGEREAFRLTRTLATADGLHATLSAEAATTAEVLERIDAVPLARQVRCADGHSLARSYRIAPGADAHLVLTRAVARVAGMELAAEVSRVGGIPAELALRAMPGEGPELPEDFLAVLGWPWTRLTPTRDGWTASLRLRGEGAERTADAEAKLDRTCAHLIESLGASPQRFHDKHRLARWRVTLRRAMPLVLCVAVLGATVGIASLDLAENSIWRMLMFHTPPLLMLLFVVLPEMPRIEIPPLPRRPRAAAWRAMPRDAPGREEACPATR